MDLQTFLTIASLEPGWDDASTILLLCGFIEECGLRESAKRYLLQQMRAELAMTEQKGA